MPNLTCPGCGSAYPLAAVQKFDRFTCAVCHQVVVVPIAGPAPARAAPGPAATGATGVTPPAPPRRAPAPHAPAHHGSAHQAPAHHGARIAPRPAPSRVNWALIGTCVAVLAVGAVGAVLVLDKPPPAPPPKPASAEKRVAAPAPPPRADPARDPAAWKALPPAERADRVAKYLAGLDRRNPSALSMAYGFLKARDETEALRQVVELELARDPASGWAHSARGDVIITDRIDRCLSECVRADEADTASIQKLAKLRKASQPETGVWWADATMQKQVDEILTEIRADEKSLQNPYAWAVAKWRIYQRRIEVMRDHPAITATVGPYLIFVQIKAPPGTPLEAVGSAELERAKSLLEREKDLFGAFDEGFHETFGKRFGLTRYDPTNLDHATLLKANVFADESTWEIYHQRMGFLPFATGVRAYYHTDEPRFLVSYDPGDPAQRADAESSQCEVAAFQALHFHTWDVTRKAQGRELSWVECRNKPVWLLHGFAAFFASHAQQAGRYAWMQPSPERLRRLWVYGQVFQKKRWTAWSLDELLACAADEQVDEAAARRVLPRGVRELTPQQDAEARLAIRLMSPLFKTKSWSLVSFLWNAADASGKPKYREGFLDLLGQSLHVQQAVVPGKGLQTQIVPASDVRKALGIATPERLGAFEREWQEWEAARLAKAQTPSWAVERDRVLAELGLR